MIVVTGASDNHYFSLFNLVNSFIPHEENNHLIIYNLGLSPDKWDYIQQVYPSLSFRVFDYSKYPEWFNIDKEAGQYAWKPTIIDHTSLEHPDKKIVWMDAGNLIQNLKELDHYLDENEVHSAVSGGDITEWTFPATIQYMNCTWIDRPMRNAACIGLNCKSDKMKDFIKEFHDSSQIKECIAPEGSNRTNHRQDQSVFSILFHKYGFHSGIHFLGYSIHNDVG